MTLTVADILNNDIYLEEKGTLADRIDFAWSFYSGPHDSKHIENDKKQALKFLCYALNINDLKEINNQLIQLMEERSRYQHINPEYIPGKSPTHLPFNPKTVIPTKTRYYGVTESPEISDAIQSKELLDVDDESKQLDEELNTIFLCSKKRAAQRVNIVNGIFIKDGKYFDTSSMHSHGKKGFAAYTLNANGELSVFIHNKVVDKIAHSSMNAGCPVVAAGELKIKNGVLEVLTTHSGHYKPSLFNVYRLLEYFSLQSVNINKAKVVTSINPVVFLNEIDSRAVFYKTYNKPMYETPASQIYSGLNELFDKNIQSIEKQVKIYKEDGIMTSLFNFKDKLIGSHLTEQRTELVTEFERKVQFFKEGIIGCLSANDLKMKALELGDIITEFQTKNSQISSGGRLASTMTSIKTQINDLKSGRQFQSLDPMPENSSLLKKLR